MKKCLSCGTEAPDDSTFCDSCGADLSAAASAASAAPVDAGACPSCGAAHEAGSTFCDSCGASLTAAASTASPAGGGIARFLGSLSLIQQLLGAAAVGALIALAIILFTCTGDSGGGGAKLTPQPTSAGQTPQPPATIGPAATDSSSGGDGFPSVADAIADAMEFDGHVAECSDASLQTGDLCYRLDAEVTRNVSRYAVGDAFSEFYASVVLEQLADGSYVVNSVSDYDSTGGGDGSDIAAHLSPIYQDAFTDAAGEWLIGAMDDGVAQRSRSLSNGSYTLSVEAASAWIAPETIVVDVGSEFYVAADVYMQTGAAGDSCGIAVAASSTFPRLEFLVFDATSEFEVLFGEQSLSFLIEKTPSSAILPGNDNRLGILKEGSQATFIINDTVVGSATVPPISVARAGVVTSTAGASGFTSCEFNLLEVRS